MRLTDTESHCNVQTKAGSASRGNYIGIDIELQLSAEAARVTARCTTALVEYLQQIIPGDSPGPWSGRQDKLTGVD